MKMELALIDAQQFRKVLRVSESSFARLALTPDFPRAIRLNLRRERRWVLDEVAQYVKRYVERIEKATEEVKLRRLQRQMSNWARGKHMPPYFRT